MHVTPFVFGITERFLCKMKLILRLTYDFRNF